MTTEHDEQSALITYVRVKEQAYPELALLFAVPNGGFRLAATAGKMRAEGVKAGVPDLCLPIARWDRDGEVAHSLWLEMKVGKKKPTEQQLWWHHELTEWGHEVAVCYSWIEAWNAIVRYLRLPDCELVK